MKHYIYAVLFIASLHSSHAVDSLILKNPTEATAVTIDYIDFLTDSSGTYSREEILSGKYDHLFRPLQKNLGVRPYYYWLRFRVKTEANEGVQILELEYPPFEKIWLYLQEGNGFVEKKSGAGMNFQEREFNVHTHAFKVPVSTQEQVIFMRIKSSSAKLPLKFIPEKKFHEHITNSVMFFSLVTGIFLVIMIINMAMYVRFLNKTNLLYTIYIFFLLLTLLCDGGLAYQYLWQDFPLWNAKSLSFLIMCVAVTHILFAANLLSLKKSAFIFYRFCQAIAILYAVIGIVILFLPNWLAFKTAVLALAVLFFLGVAAIIIAYRKGDKPVRYYFFGWISLITIVGVSFLRHLGDEPYLQGINYNSSIGSVVEIIFFAMAIGVNIKQFIEDRILLKSQLQKEEIKEDELLKLTEREKEVLELVSQGYADKEIASKLFLSIHTIKSHLRSLYHKLGVRNRVQAANKYSGFTGKNSVLIF